MSDPDPWIGTLIADRYRLTRKLGEGGMGAVYTADHVTLRKVVAVKILHTQFAKDKELVARFEREAMSSANLEHPNIVAATDFGSLADGTLYLVMEYAEGRSLRSVMHSTGKLPPSRALKILRQIGAALTRAHALDIVHRDLKPENVVVIDRREDGSELVKVIDFGIARVRSSTFGGGATGLTQVGSIFGTPAYMAPEQAIGQAVDARADQYALGVIAFEMLAGRPPFEAPDTIDLLQMHIGAPVPPISSIAPEFSAAVDAVFERFLGKLPRERFDSVADALAALEVALAGPRDSNIALASTVPAHRRIGAGLIGFIAGIPPVARFGLPAALAVALVMAVVATRSDHGTHASRSDARPDTFASSPPFGNSPERLLSSAPAPAANASAGSLAALDQALAMWHAGQLQESVAALGQLLQLDPSLADDARLHAALTRSLGEADARRAVEFLLENTALGRSREFIGAVAARGFASDRRDGLRILRLLRARYGSLSPTDALRVALREARDCSALEHALTVLESTGAGPGQDEARRIRSGDCEPLRAQRMCRACLGQGRGGDDESEE